MKAVAVRGADGSEMHRTYKLITPHFETHCVYAPGLADGLPACCAHYDTARLI